MVFGAGLLGGELKIKDRVFAWGLAGHADSEIILRSSAPLKSLRGFAGIEANTDTLRQKAKTKVIFSIDSEGGTLWKSSELALDSDAQEFRRNTRRAARVEA